ncbi:TIGR03089 family protein [Longispora urticae]
MSTALLALVGDAVRVDRPLLAYRDDATGEHVELSATDLGGWVARTASLLRDGCGLRPGDRVAVLAPPHWQTAAVLLGAWSLGLSVSFRSWAAAGLSDARDSDAPFDAVFVTRGRLGSWLETVPEANHRFVLNLAPGDAERPPAEGFYLDFLAEVGRFPDVTPAYAEVRPHDAASPDGTTYEEWARAARGVAEHIGVRPGDRLLVDVTASEEPLMWLLAPLSVGASILLYANLDEATLAGLV